MWLRSNKISSINSVNWNTLRLDYDTMSIFAREISSTVHNSVMFSCKHLSWFYPLDRREVCFTYFLLHLQSNPNPGGNICPSHKLDSSHLLWHAQTISLLSKLVTAHTHLVVNANNILSHLKILSLDFLLELVVVGDRAGVEGWFVAINSFLADRGAPG